MIPIYRAKKIDCDEYIEGYYMDDTTNMAHYIVPESVVFYLFEDGLNYEDYEIDISTLAIHFPDMIDSEGTKIFASLSEDGKGGDTHFVTWSKPWLDENDKNYEEKVLYVCIFKDFKIVWKSKDGLDSFNIRLPDEITGIQE